MTAVVRSSVSAGWPSPCLRSAAGRAWSVGTGLITWATSSPRPAPGGASFVVTGSFDGTDLTPTDVMPADEYDAPDPSDEPSFATPCPEPEGGWVVDAQQVSRVDLDAAFRVAGELPGYAGSFVDEQRDAGDRQAPIDPHGSSSIVNVSVTDDPAVAEEAIREVWGGGLCITAARYPDAELGRIQDAVNDLPGMTSSSRGDDRVDVSVVYDDGTIQAWVDEEYGDGVVVVSSALAPVD